jgi:hypothetical protein
MSASEFNAGDWYLGLALFGAAILVSPWFLVGLVLFFAFCIGSEMT